MKSLINRMLEEANKKSGTVCITVVVDVESGNVKAYAIGVNSAPLIKVRENEDLVWIYKTPTETLTEKEIEEEIKRQLEDILSILF